MYFTSPQTASCLPTFRLIYDNTVIEQVNSIKFLGVVVSEHLTWDLHIQSVCTKLNRNIGSLRNLRKSLPARLRTSVYHALIQSHINYAISVWGSGGLYNKLLPIFKCQKHALRCLFSLRSNPGVHGLPGTKTTFNTNKILTVHNQYFLSVLAFVHRDNFAGNQVQFSERKADLAIIPGGNHQYLDPNFHFMGPRLWNAFSCKFNSPNTSYFKRSVRYRLLENQVKGDPSSWEDINYSPVKIKR